MPQGSVMGEEWDNWASNLQGLRDATNDHGIPTRDDRGGR